MRIPAFRRISPEVLRENRRLGIIFLGVAGIITFLCSCKFNPFLTEYTKVENPAEISVFIQYYKGVYRQLFRGLYGLFALVIALYSLRDFVVKDKILKTLLLPAYVEKLYKQSVKNVAVRNTDMLVRVFESPEKVKQGFKMTGAIPVQQVTGLRVAGDTLYISGTCENSGAISSYGYLPADELIGYSDRIGRGGV